MTDAQVLHRRLRLLLALPLLGAACERGAEPATKSAASEGAKVEATPTTSAVTSDPTPEGEDSPSSSETTSSGEESGSSDSGGETGPPPPPPPEGLSGRPDMNMPRCPTTTWCGDQRLAARYRVGPDTGDRCSPKVALPGGFTWTDEGGRERKLSSMRSGGLDSTTTARRNAEEPRTCCYTWTEPCPGGPG